MTFLNNLLEKGFIDKQKSLQAYDAGENRFLPDRYVEGALVLVTVNIVKQEVTNVIAVVKLLIQKSLINPISKISGNKAEFKETEHFFLKLSSA